MKRQLSFLEVSETGEIRVNHKGSPEDLIQNELNLVKDPLFQNALKDLLEVWDHEFQFIDLFVIRFDPKEFRKLLRKKFFLAFIGGFLAKEINVFLDEICVVENIILQKQEQISRLLDSIRQTTSKIIGNKIISEFQKRLYQYSHLLEHTKTLKKILDEEILKIFLITED